MESIDISRTVTLPIVFPPTYRPLTTRDIGLTKHQTSFVIPEQHESDLGNHEIYIKPTTSFRAFHYVPAVQPAYQQQPAWNIAQIHEITDPLTSLNRSVQIARRVVAQQCDNAAYRSARHLIRVVTIDDGTQSLVMFASGPDMNIICFYLIDQHDKAIQQGILPLSHRIIEVFHSESVRVDKQCVIAIVTLHEAFVVRVSINNEAPLSIMICQKLSLADASYVCAALNHRMCSSERMDCAIIDSNGCIRHWSVNCNDMSQRTRIIPVDQWFDECYVENSVVACAFSSNPRTLLVGMTHGARLVDLRAPFRTDRQRGSVVQLPELAAAVPLLRGSAVVQALNPDLLPDHYFEHQIYRVRPTRVVNGALYGLATHGSIPFIVALITQDHVTLIDIRRSFHPLLDWNHGQKRCPPTLVEIVQVSRVRYVVLTLHAQRQEILLFPFEMNGDACPCSLSSAQRLPSFADLSASSCCLLGYGPPSLASVCVVPRRNTLRIFQLSHFGSVVHQHAHFFDVSGDGGQFRSVLDVEYDPLAQDDLSTVLQPSNVHVPPWLKNSIWLPHNRVNAHKLFEIALYGLALPRHCVDPSQQELCSLVDRVLNDHHVALFQFCMTPRSAFDIAYYLLEQGWLTGVNWRNLSSHGLASVAQNCFNRCVSSTMDSANTLRAFKIADRFPVVETSDSTPSSRGDFYSPVTRCTCTNSNVLGTNTFCASAHCHILHDWHFHSHPVLCAQLHFVTHQVKVKAETAAHLMDFSQDVSSLMSFVSQPQNHETQSDSQPVSENTNVIHQLLSSFASDWQHTREVWGTQYDDLVFKFEQCTRFDDIEYGIAPVVETDDHVNLVSGAGAEMAEVDERDDPVDD